MGTRRNACLARLDCASVLYWFVRFDCLQDKLDFCFDFDARLLITALRFLPELKVGFQVLDDLLTCDCRCLVLPHDALQSISDCGFDAKRRSVNEV